MPDVVILTDFGVRMNTDSNVSLEPFDEFQANLERALVVLRVHLDHVRSHGQNLNLTVDLRLKHLDFLSSRHKLIELDLSLPNIVL